ncbi:Hypothetical Protein FCC1311_017502 [Hondaea fermentalgiana]|uniref:Uncharacterized protein n=1 Tax=Hondaea fermentalgiana TaxID=2315210 RepID=A0A2R5GBN2_9STRA|nr:Hypothetical Protein FCC1311_017502 [Hondaea fermentalgiana]|eukprot:GBG25531.1 Hypothetical Protein FCC1311_017502 [Hondaea fermentalgiana]
MRGGIDIDGEAGADSDAADGFEAGGAGRLQLAADALTRVPTKAEPVQPLPPQPVQPHSPAQPSAAQRSAAQRSSISISISIFSSSSTVATRDASSINKNTMRDDEDLPLTPPALRRLRSAEPPTTASLSSTHPPSYTASPGSFDDGIASQRRTPRLDAFVRDATAMHRTSAMANLAEVDDMDDMEDDETGGPHEDDGYIAAQFTPAQVPSTAGDGLIPVARRDSTQSRASSIGAGELADDEDAGDSFEQDLQPVPVANPRGQGELRSALRGETPAVPRVQLVRPVKPRLTHARRTNANSLRAADARSRRKGPSGRQHRTRTSHRDRQQQQQQNTWDLIPLDPSPVPASVIAAEESLRRKWNAATLMC